MARGAEGRKRRGDKGRGGGEGEEAQRRIESEEMGRGGEEERSRAADLSFILSTCFTAARPHEGAAESPPSLSVRSADKGGVEEPQLREKKERRRKNARERTFVNDLGKCNSTLTLISLVEIWGLRFATQSSVDSRVRGAWDVRCKMYPLHREREQPIFSARAHVFQIDPSTKRKWLPASKHAVTVSFFYDNSRSVYRIISVGGTKAIINSTITPNMSFTKTSQKFGQWADSRANTVYGLGFSTEQQLQQFAEQFRELKEAARLAREKSQEKYELSNPALALAAPQLTHALSEERQSPPLLKVNGPEEKLFRSRSTEVEMSLEKEKVKKIPSEGSMCELNLEAELFTLQDSNAKLVGALHEANASVEQWKRQLQEYQEETDRLREQVTDLETQLGRPSLPSGTEDLSRSLEELEAQLSAKNQEIHNLQSKKSDVSELEREREEAVQRLQEVEKQNLELETRVQEAEQTLSSSRNEQVQNQQELQRILSVLDLRLCDLSELRDSLAKLISK